MADDPNDSEVSESAGRRRLAVLGSPIAHSKSPVLHEAAYRVLGLDWSYEALEMTSEDLGDFIGSRGHDWLGLSLTMPLKRAAMSLVQSADQYARQTGGANTVLLIHPDPSDEATADLPPGPIADGFNTDVGGIVRALSAAGLDAARYVHILGGGATAASALVAAAQLGAEQVLVSVRSVEKASGLTDLADSLGLMVQLRPLGIADRTVEVPELVISTLPGDAQFDVLFTDSTRRQALLLDVAYDPWPSPLAVAWAEVGGTVLSGLPMLVHQALLQVRIFVHGDPLRPLKEEEAVLQAMNAALGLDEAGQFAVPES